MPSALRAVAEAILAKHGQETPRARLERALDAGALDGIADALQAWVETSELQHAAADPAPTPQDPPCEPPPARMRCSPVDLEAQRPGGHFHLCAADELQEWWLVGVENGALALWRLSEGSRRRSSFVRAVNRDFILVSEEELAGSSDTTTTRLIELGRETAAVRRSWGPATSFEVLDLDGDLTAELVALTDAQAEAVRLTAAGLAPMAAEELCARAAALRATAPKLAAFCLARQPR